MHRCFEAGAVATGATLSVAGGDKPYAEMAHDGELAAAYRCNAEAPGRTFPDLGVVLERAAGSTEMGNVSLALPAIHPFVGIKSLPAVNHQPEFTVHCIKEEADQALHDGALAMAWTVIDMARDEGLRSRLTARG